MHRVLLLLLPVLAAPLRTPTRAAREIEIVGFEYAFRAPDTLPPGRTTFRFANRGKVSHELNVTLLKPGARFRDFIAAANAGRPLSLFIDAPVGVLFSRPGTSSPSALVTDLQPGRTYAIICIFSDSAGRPKHHALGMYAAIHVTAAAPPPAERARVDTIRAMEYVFRNEAILRPGVHYFAFVNSGKQRHEVGIHLLKRGGSLRKIMEVDKVDGDIMPYIESDLGVLHAPAGAAPAGMLRIELRAGREYMLDCGFSDTEKSPPHYKLGMYGSIIVR